MDLRGLFQHGDSVNNQQSQTCPHQDASATQSHGSAALTQTELCLSCRALALNCSAPINDKHGAEAKDWRAGKPVRVVRSVKGGKHSKYAPLEGNRYDGIYKARRGGAPCLGQEKGLCSWLLQGVMVLPCLFQVVKYWPETGKSGFLVWRYLLRRDDEEPAPWTKEGKDRMKKLGLTMQVLPWVSPGL